MSKVRIVQLLCPSRHCIVSTAYESPDGAEIPEMTERLLDIFADWVAKGTNPWCGLCYSRNLRPEDRPTKYATLAEAMPHLEEMQRQQAVTREFFKASKG
jgi:hypothetical protein